MRSTAVRESARAAPAHVTAFLSAQGTAAGTPELWSACDRNVWFVVFEGVCVASWDGDERIIGSGKVGVPYTFAWSSS